VARERRQPQWVEQLAREARYGMATLWRARGFTATVAVSLALGFALAASASAIVNAYLVQPLPFANPERLYHVRYAPPGPWEPRGLSGLDWSAVSDVVEFPIISRGDTLYLDDAGRSYGARSMRVTPGFIAGLGVYALHGRSLTAGDYSPAAERAALIGYGLWRDRYGADPALIGRVIRAESEGNRGSVETLRVVGVLPPDFYFGRDSSEKVDILLPLPTAATAYMLRLRPGVPQAFAEQRLTQAVRDLGSAIPADWPGVELESVRQRYVAQLRPMLAGLTGASALVLLIVCANVGVLVLLRTMRRQKELAVRAALGSSRRDIALMLATETAILCAIGLALGLGATKLAISGLAPLIEAQLGRAAPRGADAIAVQGTVLLVVGAIGALVALSLALLPLSTPWQDRLAVALRTDGPRNTDGPAARRVRAGLIALEVAGTLVLVVACGLLIRSVVTMARTDLGFQAASLVRGRIVLRAAAYPTPQSFFRFHDAFRERLSQATSAPVVFAAWPPFAEFPARTVESEGAAGQGVPAGAISVGGGYFSTLQIPIRAGRDLAPADVANDAPVAIVSETLARRLWPDGGSIGRQVRIIEPTPAGTSIGPWRTVVGIAGDVRQGYDDLEAGDIYTPLSPSSFGRFASFYTRTTGTTPSAVESARRVATELDPRAIVNPIGPVEEENRQMARATVLMQLLGGFTAVTALIAVVGIYGVTAYGVQQRQREIAVRIALGASQSAVIRLFLRESAWVVGGGLLCGLIGAVAASRLLGNQLWTVGALDGSALAIGAGLLGLIGMVATWWPARRGTRQSPLTALKEG
jgi:predicted permease